MKVKNAFKVMVWYVYVIALNLDLFRPVIEEVGGLCGITAIYQALIDTVATKSQLRLIIIII